MNTSTQSVRSSKPWPLVLAVSFVLFYGGTVFSEEENPLSSVPREPGQLPRKMHTAMEVRPVIRVGQKDGDLVGSDHRVLQAAVDYVAGLGGGVVEIGEGVYRMRDSLHLRSGVTVRGQGEGTVLRKAAGTTSPLALDGDYGEEQITVENPDDFQIGDGVAIRDDWGGGFHVTVATITGKRGNTFSISQPLVSDCMVFRNARAATVFPIISGYHREDVRLEKLSVDGNREENPYLNGCRGSGIFIYRCHGIVISDCQVRNYHGDGIGFQQSNDAKVLRCLSENNSHLGLHPGSGSQRPEVRSCVARRNGRDGLFLCWRVRHGIFEDNQLLENGQYGISIGHKDTDNLMRNNIIRGNAQHGIYFRPESEGMAGHRNRLVNNLIENNGRSTEAAGIMIDGQTHDIVILGNTIRETRSGKQQRQRVGIRIGEQVGAVTLKDNQVSADVVVDDRRGTETTKTTSD